MVMAHDTLPLNIFQKTTCDSDTKKQIHKQNRTMECVMVPKVASGKLNFEEEEKIT